MCKLLEFLSEKPNFEKEFDRISFFMNLGNEIRQKTNDGAIVMKGVSAYIYETYRSLYGDAPRKRVAYIIDSIKHPDEVDFLRKTYGDGFHLIGISDSFERRRSYLIDRKDLTPDQAIEILNRDDNEIEKNGQHTRDAYY